MTILTRYGFLLTGEVGVFSIAKEATRTGQLPSQFSKVSGREGWGMECRDEFESSDRQVVGISPYEPIIFLKHFVEFHS